MSAIHRLYQGQFGTAKTKLKDWEVEDEKYRVNSQWRESFFLIKHKIEEAKKLIYDK
jgi:hypothetical protein